MRKQIIPKFEADYDCKVFTTEGVTLTQIAALRATRDNPKYSVMFMDDIGIELSKREGLIDPLPADKLPNLCRRVAAVHVLRRLWRRVRDFHRRHW